MDWLRRALGSDRVDSPRLRRPPTMPLATALLSLLLIPTLQRPLEEGQVLPELRLPTVSSGELVALGDLRGRKLLLIEFASW